MATMQDFTSGARTILRDFPLFFEIDTGPLNTLSIRLPHPLVNGDSLGVYVFDPTAPPQTTNTTPTDAWQLDARNGILKITDTVAFGRTLLINGYHYTWFLDSDLDFHANQVWGEMSYYDNLCLSSLQPAQSEVIEYGVVVHALWSLLVELALDIDVGTPEGMFIPARQRYSQVLQMMQAFEQEYQSKASLMNMGLGGLSQFQLRRIALMTGRYVPVYKNREYDDPRPPVRIYPPIPEGGPEDQGECVEQSTWYTSNNSLVGNMPPGLTP